VRATSPFVAGSKQVGLKGTETPKELQAIRKRKQLKIEDLWEMDK